MSALERALGRVASSNADYGAFVALQALRDSLREHGFEAAADHLEDNGERVIAEAFSLAAWTDSVSEQQPEAIAEKARRPGGQHG